MKFKNTDSLIFDMDGTLWDAVDSYCKVWDHCSKELNINKSVTREELVGYMGKSIEQIFIEVFGENSMENAQKYIQRLDEVETILMPKLGGIPYPYMKEGMAELSKHYKLFLLSNCGKYGLPTFMEYTGITPYIIDQRNFGETQVPKSVNIIDLISTHDLKSPIYFGDTQGDCDETHKAGIPFAYAKYGFGKCENPDISFESFKDFADHFIKLKTT